jgi:hypothetical protein
MREIHSDSEEPGLVEGVIREGCRGLCLLLKPTKKKKARPRDKKRGTRTAVTHEGGSKALLGGHTEGGGGEGVAWGLLRAERNNNL